VRDDADQAANELHSDTGAPAVIVTPGEDVPNPFVLVDRGVHYLYASQPGIFDPNVPVRVGRSRETWAAPIDAMPVVPPWVGGGFTWAPDVRRVDDTYVMWFTAAVLRLGFGARGHPVMCIGVATSLSPLGPFVSTATKPAICQEDRHGSIDARTFLDDDGRLWLHWKSDDNADPNGGLPSIFAQRLAPDGVTLVGGPTEILTVDQAWEGPIVEAPQLVVDDDGRHWLFYSGNWFNQDAYAIGVAACAGPAGPCTKPWSSPWLASNAQGAGPGEASLFEDDDGLWIAYGPNQASDGPRPVAIAHVELTGEGPQLVP
jgi:hypothetical protein